MHKLSQFSNKPISFLISFLKQNDFLMAAFLKKNDIYYLARVLNQWDLLNKCDFAIGPIYTRSGLCSKRRFSRQEINPGFI